MRRYRLEIRTAATQLQLGLVVPFLGALRYDHLARFKAWHDTKYF